MDTMVHAEARIACERRDRAGSVGDGPKGLATAREETMDDWLDIEI
jgi:hypothetical protein